MEQRVGRIVRQKNENKNVKIFKYVTEGTFDAYNWAIIENKQKFIGQIFTSKSPARSADDIDETALSYAEVKALATGDPRFKEKMDLDIQVAKLKLMRSSHNSVRFEMEDKVIKYYPTEIKKTQERITGLTADQKVVQSNPVGEDSFSMIIKGKLYTDKKVAGETIIELCKTLEKADDKIDLGEYRGFPMKLFMKDGKFQIEMKQSITHTAELENNITGNITRINNILENIPSKTGALQSRIETLTDEMESAKMEADRPFPKEVEYAEKSKRLAELNTELDNEEEIEEEIDGEELDDILNNIKEEMTEIKEKPSILMALKAIPSNTISIDRQPVGKSLEMR